MKEKILQLAHRTSIRMQGLNYLPRGIVLAIDTICSVMAGIMTFIGMNLFEFYRMSNPAFVLSLFILFVVSTLVFLIFRLYKVIIRHSNIKNLPRIIMVIFLISIIFFVMGDLFLFPNIKQAILAALFYFIFASSLIIGVRVIMICTYEFMRRFNRHAEGYVRALKVFIYGDLASGVALAGYLNATHSRQYLPIAFIDLGNNFDNLVMQDMPVYGKNDLSRLESDIRNRVPDAVIFSSPRGIHEEKLRITEWCNNSGVKLFVAPTLDTFAPDAPIRINPVQIEDLLDRSEIQIEVNKIKAEFHEKTIMVTGAAGSIGSELVRQLCKFSPSKIILLDCAETPLHLIRLEIEEKYPDVPICPIIADVRNKARCSDIVKEHRPAIIFHAAAYKHVPLMEELPCEAVVTNIMGTINMAELARENNVQKFVMISTDKAVNPTNVMGATKRAAEMYVQSLNSKLKQEGSSPTRYITTRFGNVLGSNGSVIPRFREQIIKGGPITVTHPEIVRFFMTIPEACRLVLQAGTMGSGGEIFVFDMGEPVKIADLAHRMIQLSGLKPGEDIKIEYTGLRPGEKLYEEVLSSVESTTESSHHKIRIAQAIHNTFEDIYHQTSKLIDSALSRDMEAAVIGLKTLIPEFKSKNSPYEKYDK